MRENMVRIPGGTFRMGSDKHHPEEAPVREEAVGAFWMDRYTVTNREFRKFVDATGYVTNAERPVATRRSIPTRSRNCWCRPP